MSRPSHRQSRPLEHLFRATTQSGISKSRMTSIEPGPNVQRLNMELDGSIGQDKKPSSSINRIAAYERQHLPTGRRVVDTEVVDHCFGSDVDHLANLDDCSSE